MPTESTDADSYISTIADNISKLEKLHISAGEIFKNNKNN